MKYTSVGLPKKESETRPSDRELLARVEMGGESDRIKDSPSLREGWQVMNDFDGAS